MSNELLDLDTQGKEVVLQSTWLFYCLLGGEKIQREGSQAVLHPGPSTPRCSVMVRIVALCPPWPSPVGITVDWWLETDEIQIFFKKVKNALNDEQVLGVENAFKSVCPCYSICVIHRQMPELQKTASLISIASAIQVQFGFLIRQVHIPLAVNKTEFRATSAGLLKKKILSHGWKKYNADTKRPNYKHLSNFWGVWRFES